MIKFVYFDVGGVVIRDFSGTSKWQELIRDIGIIQEQEKDFADFFNPLEVEVCLGKDLESLIPIIESRCNVNFPQNYSFLEDFVRRFEACN